MRRLTPVVAFAALIFTACIRENPQGSRQTGDGSSDGSSHNNNSGDGRDNSSGCAAAPSGAGSWENNSSDGLHCNYEWTSSGEWAYHPNSNETGCIEESWAPSQSCGEMKPWEKNGVRGCDWVIR